eukprot:Lithocolla_globosa_v1_NODE_7849_length_894_cov_3.998808.p1 type:complete len:196 gc:universal NODE_7849_length_894_cov_3.998808:806-219(-)
MPDYSKAKIYKIVCNETDDVYIGSTCQPLFKRMYGHRMNYRNWKSGKQRLTTSFKILKYDSAQIVLIEVYPCQSKEELHARERSWIEQFNYVNKYIPTRTKKEYRQVNTDKISERHRRYHQANNERINEKSRQYYQDNIERINERQRQYYQSNSERLSTPNECECGGCFTRANKTKHKTKKHQHWLSTQPPDYEQ